MQCPGDNAGPARLVIGAETGPIVAVEVLIEQDQITPVRILLKLANPPIDRPPTILVFEEYACQPAADLFGNLVQGHLSSRARRALDFEIVAVVKVVLEQGANYQSVH